MELGGNKTKTKYIYIYKRKGNSLFITIKNPPNFVVF